MLVEIKYNTEKVKKHNKVTRELMIEYPEYDYASDIIDKTQDNKFTKTDVKGTYLTGLNARYAIPDLTNLVIKGDWEFAHGVSDNLGQILDFHYKELKESCKRKFIVCATPIIKAEQPKSGGWRWHKWGEYIGYKEPQHEYLVDEDESFNKLYVYSIYELE